uniref:28S ribosomal protein S17, mitochondrial n=1 Tax=Clastoptera arizonana TaxID=38151 RepID=A0A1B6D0Q3_9HEMI
MALNSIRKSFMFIGKCVPSVKTDASKIAILKMDFDANLTMYFRKVDYVFAHDPEKKCKTGDIVLVEELPQKLTTLIGYRVKEVVYPYGDVTDPITGKKCMIGKYRDEVEFESNLYGKNKEAFDYYKAPPRGWQANKKDFTDKPTYKKYHVFENEDPYAV